MGAWTDRVVLISGRGFNHLTSDLRKMGTSGQGGCAYGVKVTYVTELWGLTRTDDTANIRANWLLEEGAFEETPMS